MFNLCTCYDDSIDVDLVACLQRSRCEQCLGRLLRQYEPMISAATRRACSGVGGAPHAADADAARHGAWLGLHDAALKFRFNLGVPFAGMARPYVYGAARRELLLQLGWTTEGVQPPCTPLAEVPLSLLSASVAVDKEFQQNSLGALAAVVLTMGEGDVRLVADLYVFDKSITEVAAARGVRQQTISAHNKRVLSRLKCAIEKLAA